MVNRDALPRAAPEVPVAVELEEGEPVLECEVLALIAKGQGATPGGQRWGAWPRSPQRRREQPA